MRTYEQLNSRVNPWVNFNKQDKGLTINLEIFKYGCYKHNMLGFYLLL